jgi:hypothetical protein
VPRVRLSASLEGGTVSALGHRKDIANEFGISPLHLPSIGDAVPVARLDKIPDGASEPGRLHRNRCVVSPSHHRQLVAGIPLGPSVLCWLDQISSMGRFPNSFR